MNNNNFQINGRFNNDPSRIPIHMPPTEAELRARGLKNVRRGKTFNLLMGTLLGLLEVLLAAPVVFDVLAFDPGERISLPLNFVSGLLTAPFRLLVGSPTFGHPPVDAVALIAMVVYFIIFALIGSVVQGALKRSSSKGVQKKKPGR